jgi:hypothetical protein
MYQQYVKSLDVRNTVKEDHFIFALNEAKSLVKKGYKEIAPAIKHSRR